MWFEIYHLSCHVVFVLFRVFHRDVSGFDKYYVYLLFGILFSPQSVVTYLRALFFPSLDTIVSVVPSGIFGIIGVPSRPLPVCPVQEVDDLCPMCP